MRKHRLYGVAIAVLLGTSLIDHRPSSPHHAAGVDLRRTGIRLASAALPADGQHPPTTSPTVPSSVDLLRPVGPRDVEALWSWRAYLQAPASPPPPPVVAPATAPKAAPAVLTAVKPAARPSAGAVPAATRTTVGVVWADLRQCESGGNYADNTGNGYYGAYQFSLSTWHGLGLTGLPSQASPAVQDQAAQRLQARSGWGQWPNCSRRLPPT